MFEMVREIVRKILKFALAGIDSLCSLSGGIGAVLISIITLITVYDTFMRYALNKPSLWRMDVSVSFLLVFCFLALGYAQRKDAHVRMSLVTNYLPRKIRIIETILMNFVSVAICGLFAYAAFVLFSQSLDMHELTWNLILPVAPLKLFFAIGLIVWGLALFAENINLLYKLTSSPQVKASMFDKESGQF